MSQWEITRHQVAIAGTVRDHVTGKPLPGATVSISGASGTQVFQVESDGHFHALDLANGTYQVEASLPGGLYGNDIRQVEVIRTGEGKILMAVAEMQLADVH